MQVPDPIFGTMKTVTVALTTIADRQWHYICQDISGVAQQAYNSYPARSLVAFQVFSQKTIFIFIL